MADFSLLGLIVDDYDRTLHLLAEQNLPFSETAAGMEYDYDDSGELRNLVMLLQAGGVNCVISDVAEQIYQG